MSIGVANDPFFDRVGQVKAVSQRHIAAVCGRSIQKKLDAYGKDSSALRVSPAYF